MHLENYAIVVYFSTPVFISICEQYLSKSELSCFYYSYLINCGMLASAKCHQNIPWHMCFVYN